MKVPEYLKKGDKVAIVCPASYLGGGIDAAIEVLESWGLVVQVGQTVTAQHHRFAGDDALRRKDVQNALDDPEIKAIFAARGGYGTVRIIDDLDFSRFMQRPKWIVGFSDITVLHSHLQHQLGVCSIHGQMPKSFGESSEEALRTLHASLFGDMVELVVQQGLFPNRPGRAQGQLIGGNLAILHSVLASPSDGAFDDKILFLEDVGEPLYNIDRMLWALKRAGKFKALKGLMVGGFSGLKDPEPGFGQTVEEIIFDKVAAYDFPVAFHVPAGHIPDNRSLVLGSSIDLEVELNSLKLTYL